MFCVKVMLNMKKQGKNYKSNEKVSFGQYVTSLHTHCVVVLNVLHFVGGQYFIIIL